MRPASAACANRTFVFRYILSKLPSSLIPIGTDACKLQPFYGNGKLPVLTGGQATIG